MTARTSLAILIALPLAITAAPGAAVEPLPAPGAAVEPLPALAIDTGAMTVSGISSGGFMAHQLHVAHASTIAGAAVIAGGPYHCAGGGYPANLPRALAVCMDLGRWTPFLGPPNVDRLVGETQAQAAAGAIDDPAGLREDRVFLFSGTGDDLVPTAIRTSVRNYYARFLDGARIRLVDDVPAAHAMVTADFGAACHVSETPFLVDCDYDLAGELLGHLHGPLRPPVQAGPVTAFDQSAFSDDPAAASLAPVGYVYVPEGCRAGARCGLHVAFHGCLQNAATIGDAFVAHAGYNGWAEANHIVVLYPQTAADEDPLLERFNLSVNPMGCWDWWGYTGADFHLQSGRQIRAVKAMVDRLAATVIRHRSGDASVAHQHRHGHVLEHVPGDPAQHQLPPAGVAISAHDEQVDRLVGGARQQHVAHVDVVGEHVLRLAVDAVPRQVQADVGAGNVAVPLGATLRVDGDDGDVLGGFEQRHGVVHGAAGEPAGVPRDQYPLADLRIPADVGDHQDRPSHRQDQPVRHVPLDTDDFGLRIALPDDDDIGVAAMQRQRRLHIAFDTAPFGADAGADRPLVEVVLGFPGCLDQKLHLATQQVLAELVADEALHVGGGDDVKADEMGLVRRRQGDGGIDAALRRWVGIDVDDEIFECHATVSSLRSPRRSRLGPRSVMAICIPGPAASLNARPRPRTRIGRPGTGE